MTNISFSHLLIYLIHCYVFTDIYYILDFQSKYSNFDDWEVIPERLCPSDMHASVFVYVLEIPYFLTLVEVQSSTQISLSHVLTSGN